MPARRVRRIRWPLLAIGALLVAILAMVFVVVGGPLANSLLATPSASASPSAAVVRPALEEPGDDTAWWRLRFEQGMGGQIVEVGTLGAGAVAQVELRTQSGGPEDLIFPNRSVIGPRAGLVVIIGVDGPEAVLSSVDTATGEVRELIRTSDLIVDAQFVAGTSVMFLTGDGATGQLTGSWLIDAAAPAEPEPVEGLLGIRTDAQLVARVGSVVRLLVSPAGDMAAVHRCGVNQCALRAVNLVDGRQFEQQIAFAEEPIGLGGQLAVLRAVCMQAACPGELLDLATGERRPVPDVGVRITFDESVIAADDGAALLTQVPAAEPAGAVAFVVTDLATEKTGLPVQVALGSMLILGTWGSDLGVELPPGWFAVRGSLPEGAAGGNFASAAFAIEAATGRVVPLPELGEFLIQG